MLDEDERAGRGVEPCGEASSFRGAKGKAGYEWQAAALKTWQPKHRDGGAGQAPKPRSGARLRAGLYL